MKLKLTTYRAFLDSIQNGSASQLPQNTTSIIEHFRPVKQIVSRFAPATFLLDYATKKYIYVEETCFNLLGYTAQWFLETGIEEYLSKWHEADFEVINTKVFPDNIAFLKPCFLSNSTIISFPITIVSGIPAGNILLCCSVALIFRGLQRRNWLA